MAQTNRIALLQKAEDAAHKGNYDEALGIVSRCLDLYPGFSPARVLKGEILSRTGNPDDAIVELREIIASNPENIRARMILTELLIQQNDQKQAMIHLEFLSFMVPENDPALLDLRQRAEALHPESVEEGKVQTLEFGIVDEPEGDEPFLPDEPGKVGDENVILEDEVTEIFREEDLKKGLDEGTFQVSENTDEGKTEAEDVSNEQLIMTDVDEDLEEVLESEVIQQNEVETVHVPEEQGEGEDLKKADVEINTLTMARVYERQKMYTEALDVLEAIYAKKGTEEIADEIKRVRGLSESRASGSEKGRRLRVIASLNHWMEKITCNSTN